MAVKKANKATEAEVKVETPVVETPEVEVDETPAVEEQDIDVTVEETETPEVEIPEVEVEEPKADEPKVEVDQSQAQVNTSNKPNGNVKIRMRVDHKCTIAMERYDLKAGKTYIVPENVKRILNNAGLLAPL